MQPGPALEQNLQAPASFEEALKLSLAGRDARQALEEALAAVEREARSLLQLPSLERLGAYKQAVRRFLELAVGGAYAVERHGAGVLRRGGRRFYVIVRRVDEALERLTAAVLEAQGRGLGLVAAVDEIRGLLVDLRR